MARGGIPDGQGGGQVDELVIEIRSGRNEVSREANISTGTIRRDTYFICLWRDRARPLSSPTLSALRMFESTFRNGVILLGEFHRPASWQRRATPLINAEGKFTLPRKKDVKRRAREEEDLREQRASGSGAVRWSLKEKQTTARPDAAKLALEAVPERP